MRAGWGRAATILMWREGTAASRIACMYSIIPTIEREMGPIDLWINDAASYDRAHTSDR